MSGVKKVLKRNEVPTELTWDLSIVFETDQEFEKAFKSVQDQAHNFKKYQGTLKQGPKKLLAAVQELLEIYRQTEKVYVYASMKNDQDTTNSQYQGMFSRTQAMVAQLE